MSADPEGIDLEGLAQYLDRKAPGLLSGSLTGRLIAGGRSNLTYLVTDGVGTWVVRRPPLGHVLETAHDMQREHRVMAALGSSEVPVPGMIALCRDAEALGFPFYVMQFVDGAVLRTQEQLTAVGPDSAVALADELVDVLVRLHGVDPHVVGLGDLGRPAGYLKRQVYRWGRQLKASYSREVPGLADLGGRLAQAVPESQRVSLVHGDYKLDNLLVDPADPGHVLAVLDWEMATLGDPLSDLVNAALWWDGVRDAQGVPFVAAPGELPGFPASSQMLDRYAAATGTDLNGLAWYFGLACYKLAAIFEGIAYRNKHGLTVGEGFDRAADFPARLARRGHDALDGCPTSLGAPRGRARDSPAKTCFDET